MCGIVGYIGPDEGRDILMNGLSRLEYRGYDSAGIAMVGPDSPAADRPVRRQTKRTAG